MPHAIPEKTAELWTALAVQAKCDNWATVCSRPSDPTQFEWPPGLRQWLLLEPKAPQLVPTDDEEGPGEVSFRIDRRQLDSYVDGYLERQHPDVLYVLPDPRLRPSSGRHRHGLPIAQRDVWQAFPEWSVAVRSTDLQRLTRTGTGQNWATVHLGGDRENRTVQYRPHPTQPTRERGAHSLNDVLDLVVQGREPPGISLRSDELPALPMSRGSQVEHRDLALSPEAIRAAQQALSRKHAGHLLIVGLPWYRADPLRIRT